MADDLIPFSWEEFPHGASGEDQWSHFKNHAYAEFKLLIQKVDRDYGSEPQRRLECIRQIRREHHLTVIADRIRRSSASQLELSGNDLRKAAEFVLDRNAYIAVDGKSSTQPRSRLEEKFVLSARVNWHKIMRRAGSHAEIRGGWADRKPNRRTSAILKKLSAPGLTADKRGEIFRKHVEDGVQQLLSIARELTVVMRCELPHQDRALIHDLDDILVRAKHSDEKSGNDCSRRNIGGRSRRVSSK